MAFIILNANMQQWGSETYSTEEAARRELREFWRGVPGVKLSKFTIVETEQDASR
jgi:hypothetical protein